MTMVGSSPLILLNDLILTSNKALPADQQMETWGLFSVTPIGIALVTTGILYFVIAKLCLIEPMYEFSLGYVKKLYEQGLGRADSASIIDLRIKKLNESITKIMFTSISRALF